ncbi:MAG: urease accessory protein UreD [Polyangiaceae bacterium]|nr:urease accessory protein UreD [Polyangiaceae bacterium]MCB9608191.1 urease accessory protein UreD [Polyangiaceae bacterium]
MALALEPQTPGWRAELNLICQGSAPHGSELAANKSVIRHRRRSGPLALQRVLYPEGPSPCHAILLHPPGGVAGGDLLAVDVAVTTGGGLFGTTPASTKFYKSAGRRARSVQHLRVSGDACLEWFPQETLVFNEAELELETEVELEPGSGFAAWEIVCLGRHHMGERFERGSLLQRWTIWRRVGSARRRVFHERLALAADDPMRGAPWGLGGRRVFASLVLSCDQADTNAQLRDAIGKDDSARLVVGLTRLDGLVVVRALADAPGPVRGVFEALWGRWRELERGQAPHRPRIWDT